MPGRLESMLKENILDILASENLELPDNLEANIRATMQATPDEARLHGLTKALIVFLGAMRKADFLAPSSSTALPPPPPARPPQPTPPIHTPSHGGTPARESVKSSRGRAAFRTPSLASHGVASDVSPAPSSSDGNGGLPRFISKAESSWSELPPPEKRPWDKERKKKEAGKKAVQSLPEKRPPVQPERSKNVPLLKSGKCPFCPHVFSRGEVPTIHRLCAHFASAGHSEEFPGSYFKCSSCPGLQWRSRRVLRHINYEKCGGSVVFEYDPSWTDDASSEQNRKLRGIREQLKMEQGVLRMRDLPNNSAKVNEDKATTSNTSSELTITTINKRPRSDYSPTPERVLTLSPMPTEQKKLKLQPEVPARSTPPIRSSYHRDPGNPQYRLRDVSECPWCPKVFVASDVSMVTFYKHFEACHEDVPGTILGCSLCPDVAFRSDGPIKKHLEICGGQAILNHCPEAPTGRRSIAESPAPTSSFSSPTKNAAIRMMEDSVKERAANPIDTWKAKRKERLNQKFGMKEKASGKGTHTSQFRLRNFDTCPFCSKKFVLMDNEMSANTLDKHMQMYHADVRGTFYSCSACPNVIARTTATFKIHFRIRRCNGHMEWNHKPEVKSSGGVLKCNSGFQLNDKPGCPKVGEKKAKKDRTSSSRRKAVISKPPQHPENWQPVDQDQIPLLPSAECPFCAVPFERIPTPWILYRHIRQAGHADSGALFICSRCPELRWRAPEGPSDHHKKSRCGGSIVFEHYPDWNNSKTQAQAWTSSAKKPRKSGRSISPTPDPFDDDFEYEGELIKEEPISPMKLRTPPPTSTALVVESPVLSLSVKEDASTYGQMPLLPSLKCPFCPYIFDVMPHAWGFYTHLTKMEHTKKYPGAFFTCSSCPEKRWRSPNTSKNHPAIDGCGGTIIFEHYPQWNAAATRKQIKAMCRSRASLADGPVGSRIADILAAAVLERDELYQEFHADESDNGDVFELVDFEEASNAQDFEEKPPPMETAENDDTIIAVMPGDVEVLGPDEQGPPEPAPEELGQEELGPDEQELPEESSNNLLDDSDDIVEDGFTIEPCQP